MDEQARSSQHLSSSTAEISLPPSEDSDRMSGQVENDDGLGLVQSDTPVGAADGDSTQITSTLTAFSAYGHKDPNIHTTNEAQLYGLVEPNVHPQALASSSQSGVDPHAFGNVMMPVMYQQMFQVPPKPNETVQDTSANGKRWTTNILNRISVHTLTSQKFYI
uniref:Uncharacterized protein n=1 Tax=Zea mays TaxID=4577 RepID=A0A804PDB9_MAIZE